MKTKQLADWLGLAGATIRLWALESEYGRYLSPAGAGGDGRTRQFNDRDARILAHVAQLKTEGMPREEIYLTLDALRAGDWHDLPPMPPAPPSMGPIRMIPESTAETAVFQQRAALLREIAFLQERVEELTKEIAGERVDKERLLRELAAAERELEFWRSGRLKPE